MSVPDRNQVLSPNILGKTSGVKFGVISGVGEGAFSSIQESEDGAVSFDSQSYPVSKNSFDASRSSSIFSGSTLQPAACQTLIAIRF